ncbi:MAG TPA: cell division FtsA domain-containing protein [Clostridia bacterium]|nr:cell division FtsA domain-containing protein [Clostridia bacterium]
MSQNTAILDIGSSKVICLICGDDGKDNILVQGAGIREYRGYRRGQLEDEQSLSDAIVDALSAAETEAKHRVRDISVGVPAPFMKLVCHEGRISVKNRNKRVTHKDVDELINASLDFEAPAGFELISSTPVEFVADGMPRADTPMGMSAAELGSYVSHIYVDGRFKRLVSDALLRVGLDADMYIAVPLSEGLFVIPEDERARGAVLIDTGAAHTDVCLIRNGALVDIRTIDAGGNHFTSDLCYGLGLTRPVAENVKRRYVYSLDYQDSIDTIRNPNGGVMKVEHETIQYIIEERTRELAMLISAAMREMGAEPEKGVSVYMTGGGVTLMRGSCEFMEREMGLPIQVRMPWMPRLSSPNYASAFSVMDFVMHATDEDNAGRLEGAGMRRKAIRKLRDFFKL